VKGEDPNKKRYPGPSGCELCVELTTYPVKIYIVFVEELPKLESGRK
jgi:hypothetical protein